MNAQFMDFELNDENKIHNLFSIVKCCEKNKMDNAKNGYSSADNTGKIKKNTFMTRNRG